MSADEPLIGPTPMVLADWYAANRRTLDASPGAAGPRLLVLIPEIHQNEDGGATVPEPLRPYFNGWDRSGESALFDACTPA